MQHSGYSDDQLVDLLKSDDPAAFELIYRRYWQSLYGFAYQQLGSKEEAEGIVHDLMLSVWQNRHQVRIQNLRIYLFTAGRNLTNKCIRSQINLRKYREYQLMHEVWEHFAPGEIDSTDELLAAVEKVLDQMPQKTAAIFRMSKFQEMPVKTIASQLDLTEKAVEYHITKSLKMMRKHLHRFQSDN